ncbi:hypothetical protein IC582_005512 [Cucumis melo]
MITPLLALFAMPTVFGSSTCYIWWTCGCKWRRRIHNLATFWICDFEELMITLVRL